jgi:hypothetical protein
MGNAKKETHLGQAMQNQTAVDVVLSVRKKIVNSHAVNTPICSHLIIFRTRLTF